MITLLEPPVETTTLPALDTQAVWLAEQLGETQARPRLQIQRALQICGSERVHTLLAETQAVEAQGGQPLVDGGRRTPGGIFFHLLRQQVSAETWRQIRGVTAAPAPAPAQPLDWADRTETVALALAQPGAVATTRVTVVGRPAEVKFREDFVIANIPGGHSLPALPRGLPAVARAATMYKVCVEARVWQRVEAALRDPQAVLISDGYAVANSKMPTVTVLARFAVAKPARTTTRSGLMRLQLTGRPGALLRHGLTTVTALVSRQAPRLPEGLPEPPPVTYVVYGAEKQWDRVAETPGAAVVVDGYCFYDADLRHLAVLAQNVMPRPEAPVGRPFGRLGGH